MRYFSIGSGSSGNCAFIGTDKANVLLDAGLSAKKTIQGLNLNGIDPKDIDAIFITHEHRDHIGGLGVLLRKFNIPVFATGDTIKAILKSDFLGEMDGSLFNEIGHGIGIKVADLSVEAINISHDAIDPIAYKFSKENKSLGIVSDLGKYDENLINFYKNMDGIVLEANHDVNMLQLGPYPYQLKRRILSDYGHLSNEDSGRFLSDLLHDNLKWVVLSHLSAENNYDKLALETVFLEITLANNKYRAKDFPISVAPRCETGEVKII